MSFYSTPNEEEYYSPPELASTGAQVGFMEGVRRSWEYGNLYESQLGVVQALLDEERANDQRIIEAGGEAPDSAYYQFSPQFVQEGYHFENPIARDTAYKFAKATTDGDFGMYNALVGDRDERLKALQAKFPRAGIKTYSEQYGAVREKYEKMRAGLSRDYTKLGTAGWLVGGMASGVNPEVNPLSFFTLPIGGWGKTVAGRIASEGAVQGVVQGLEEVTGIRANKRLLGGDPTVQESLANIALATGGGAALRGLGEGGYAIMQGVKRKWFTDTPADPAPKPEAPETLALPAPALRLTYQPRTVQLTPEFDARVRAAVQDVAGTGRATMRGVQTDYFHAAQQLEAWNGPAPWEIAPPMSSRLPGGAISEAAPVAAKTPGESIDEIARRIDPDTFRIYDKLAAKRQAMRDQIDAALTARADAADNKLEINNAQMVAMKQEITDLEIKIAKSNKRKGKIYEARRKELIGALADLQTRTIGADEAAVATYRKALLEADERMRDMAPAVSRAYARAEGKWNAYEGQRAEIEKMVMRGDSEVSNDYAQIIEGANEALHAPSIRDVVPELSGPVARTPDEPAIAVVERQAEADAKLLDEQLEAISKTAPKLVEAKGDEAKLEIEGATTPVDLSEEIPVVMADGTVRNMSIRQALEDIDEDNIVLGAVTSCSIVKAASAIA